MNPRQSKRVVTGVDASGRSIITSDGPPPTILGTDSSVTGWLAEHWVTARTPPPLEGGDLAAGEWQAAPDAGGTLFRTYAIPPAGTAGSDTGHHTTNTVDYVVILSGHVWLVLDDGEVELGPGDCAVQRGTAHAWVNRRDEPCVAAAVLVDAGRSAVDPSEG